MSKTIFDRNYPLNWETGLKMFGGDEDMYKMIIDEFASTTYEEQLLNSYQAILDENWTSLKSEAHRLKGTSGYIAAEKLIKASTALQTICQKLINQDPNTTKEQVVDIYLEFMREAIVLKEYLDQQKNQIFDAQKFLPYINNIQKKYKSNQKVVDFQQTQESQCCLIF